MCHDVRGSGVGGVVSSEIDIAQASDVIIIGFDAVVGWGGASFRSGLARAPAAVRGW